MRTTPLPSPAEAPSPIAAPHSHRRNSSQSTGFIPIQNAGFSVDADAISENSAWNANSHSCPLSHEQTANACHIQTPTKKDSPEAGKYPEDQGRSLQTLRELRRQMEELLVYQQMQQSQSQTSSANRETPPSQTDPLPSSPGSTRKKPLNVSFAKVTSSSGELPSASYSDSTGSGGTIRAVDTPENFPSQTPSYPFPRMQTQPTSRPAQPTAKPTQESPINRSAFKLTLPSEKMKIHMASSKLAEESQPTGTDTQHFQSVFLPPNYKSVVEDPNYPSPNLYELTLRLNADPGLDAWWTNVVHILQAHYGAERASLAVPGDATDLENVPWGQKAVFDRNIETESQARHLYDGTTTTRDDDLKENKDVSRRNEVSAAEALANGSSAKSPKRPSLLSRHSFAGFGKERKNHNLHETDAQHLRGLKAPSKPENKRTCTIETPAGTEPEQSSRPLSSSQNNLRQAVFPIPRPLEVETDPLVKRTGVVKLFGRTEPVVLTREYSQGLAIDEPHCETPEDRIQVTPTAEPCGNQPPHTVPVSNPTVLGLQGERMPAMEFFDEYEQIPPSPWSQSPAPSPAPRAHAEQNPFFVSHAVDEEAFAKHPPPHDYSNLNPLEAIGVDMAKSVVHIPLLHAGRSKQTSPSTLRFPVAVISILSPIMPYPSNLRKSLAYLMPHLTTSFCLAQQYSQLERQVTSRLEAPRYGHLLGLGGTFSDESSELELVAGLSGHVHYTIGDDGSLSARASLSSPEERSNSAKLSPAVPGIGTPGFDLSTLGTGAHIDTNESPGLTTRVGGDGVDSYFNVQQSKHIRDAITQHRNRLSKAKQNVTTSTPTSPGKFLGNLPMDEELATQVQSPTGISPSQDIRAPPVISPTQASSRQPSANSFYAHLQRELPRPFTDTVAQLMLNSVPLHLFLAKPQSGEVIWTNSKFDAYRRSQPQEQKLRDPWQNIHNSERQQVSQEWANALRTGSQFTERVRVKRFNDESAYRWFIFRANPLLSATGEVLYWIGSFLDIHEQHIAELKATQEREKFATDAKYRAFSNSIPQIVFEATEYRGLIFVNEQWHLYTGQKLEEALNFGFAKHVHHDDLEKCGLLSLYLSEAQKNGSATESGEAAAEGTTSKEKQVGHGVTPALEDLVRRGVASVQRDENGRVFYSTEIRIRSRGGDFRWHLVRLVCVETSSFGSGEASWYGTCTDINDRKNLERELNKAMQQLNNQMESKTKFFSNMSHEIRTPLNGILGTIPFILDTQLDTDQRRMLDTIQNSSTNLRELVDNILDVSRVEAGKMSLVNSWFHVRSVIEDVIDTVSSRAIDKGLEINYLMDVDVPPMVIGDRFRIRQVLINLVGNAVKFTAQGEIHICCSIYHDASAHIKRTELLLNFDVVDTGKGFSARDAERLMQRFSQLGQNGSQQHAGSGLGLFLSKQLVEMHGGRLTPSSKEGQGAKFSFHVKVDAPPPPSPDEPRSLQNIPESLGPQPKPSSLKKLLFSKELLDNKGLDSAELSSALESSLSKARINTDTSRLPSSTLSNRSSFSSALPTPDLSSVDPLAKVDTSKPTPSQTSVSTPGLPDTVTPDSGDAPPVIQPSPPHTEESPTPTQPTELSTGSEAKQTSTAYSILILCPLDNTRKAIKQHIEQVVPLEVSFSIASTPDAEDWRDSVNDDSLSKLTHLVLNLPSVDDVLDVIQYVSESDPATAPTLVIISDLYQKRQINTKIKELASTGKRVYTVPKPVKPSAFSAIFDPDNRRDLSKDRNQDMAREINNNFKTMSKMVKEVIGNKGYRILLVEDDDTNRMVMLKYLDKIKVMAETATNGQECTEMVFSKEPGYYSLIIVST
ncbi:sensor histidine kinase/response regulator [Aspergillus heteromorphus CBS 117.55]|uniref:histidine kinase n=1 Tax=Aspergillus heteromorphus CBS 117.55 TaxID=1448321 RepID=A0A317WUR4_9EURO|nr:sensor histidine kinase/response regulator [Aspergillus heteromorphus CBS 117.55]PWY90164.1 sensor histidine kinase/response regulator [Aspergillus heteromorphus CBS 117.55]